MSLLKKIGGVLKSAAKTVLPVAATVMPALRPIAAAVGAFSAARQGTQQAAATPVPSIGGAMALPIAPLVTAARAVLPGVGALTGPAAIGFGVGRAVRSARAIANAAAAYCRRHPAWCASIGGLAAVEGLVRQGQLPIPKRRRAKGISPRELSAFKRVSKVLNTWCKVPQPMRRRSSKRC